MPKWTNEQLEAITKEGENIIVSAGAGSGKTAVLTQRVIHKLKKGSSINRLLILTFTNAAAFEMKERIRKSIMKEETLQSQLALIDGAYITTFDSFALSMVKKYHYLLNLDPQIQITEESVLYYEKEKILDQVMEQFYQSQDPDFLKLIQDFCVKNDREIRESVLKISAKLDLKYDKLEYLKNDLPKFYEEENLQRVTQDYLAYLKENIESINHQLKILADFVDADYISKLLISLQPLLEAQTYSEIFLSFPIKLPNLPRNCDSFAKEAKNGIQKLLQELDSCCIYDDDAEIKRSILATRPYIAAISKLIIAQEEATLALKKKKSFYEFQDISKMAIRLLKQNENVARELRDFFQEIMVDEYQDTSDLQEEFIRLIARDNVYMVGDIKQSIYRFRNANPYIFKSKYDSYAKGFGGYKIDLTKNFRSRKETLEDINLIFNQIMDDFIGGADYQNSHQMIFGNTSYLEEGKTKENSHFEIYEYEHEKGSHYTKEEKEAFIIAADIQKKKNQSYLIFDKEQGHLRPIQYQDFVILIDRTTKFDLYKKIFEYCRIPLMKYTDTSITDHNDVSLLKNLIGLIIGYRDQTFDLNFKYCFTSVARSFLIEMSDQEIYNILNSGDFSHNTISQIIDSFVDDVDILSLREIMEIIIEKFAIDQQAIKVGDVASISMRLEYLSQIATSISEYGYTLDSFYEYLDYIIKMGYSIKVGISEQSEDSVKIMSIHKSKGLEYPVCYYPGLYTRFNISDTSEKFQFDPNYGMIAPYWKEGLAPTILKTLFQRNYMIEEVSEKIRLFYVALTRCREKMILLVPKTDSEAYGDTMASFNKAKYRCFLDILKSIEPSLLPYRTLINWQETPITKEYRMIKQTNYETQIITGTKKVLDNSLSLEYHKLERERFSHATTKKTDASTIEKLELGKKLHYYLETLDFKNPNFDLIDPKYRHTMMKFFEQNLDFSSAHIYKEYEFVYNENKKIRHGIIDLMLEYEDHIQIIDYKLKNLTDLEYTKQLYGYRDFIAGKTRKKVRVFLYSIFSGELKEL